MDQSGLKLVDEIETWKSKWAKFSFYVGRQRRILFGIKDEICQPATKAC